MMIRVEKYDIINLGDMEKRKNYEQLTPENRILCVV